LPEIGRGISRTVRTGELRNIGNPEYGATRTYEQIHSAFYNPLAQKGTTSKGATGKEIIAPEISAVQPTPPVQPVQKTFRTRKGITVIQDE